MNAVQLFAGLSAVSVLLALALSAWAVDSRRSRRVRVILSKIAAVLALLALIFWYVLLWAAYFQ